MGLGVGEKEGRWHPSAPQEGPQAEGMKVTFLELGILLHWVRLNTGGVRVCPQRLIAVSILPSIWRDCLWKDSLCARDSLLLGFLLKDCFLCSLRRKRPIEGRGKITKESFDSTWLGTWLNYPISDISPNTSLLGRFPFQAQSVVSAAFQDKIPHFWGISHKTGNQWTQKWFAKLWQ